MSLSRTISVNTLSAFGGRVVSGSLGLVTIGFMTRSLGREGFGEYSTITAYLAFFMILADFGLQPLLTREISQSEVKEDAIVSDFFNLRLFSSLFFLLIGFFAVFFFPYPSAVKLGAGIGMGGFFFLSLSQLLLSVFQKHFAMHLAALAEVLGRAFQLLVVFFIFKSAGGLFWFLLAMSLASFLIFLSSFYFMRRYTKVKIRLGFDYKRMWGIVRSTWPIALSLVVTLVYFKIDTILLSLLKPPSDVGVYGVAYRVLEGLIFFPAIFAGILMPILSKEAGRDMERFKSIFGKSTRIVVMFAAPLVCGGVVLSYSIVRALGGAEFLASGAPLQPIFLAIGFIFLGNLFGRAVIALDLQKKALFIYIFGMLVNVVLNLIFIPKYTYMAAAWTTALTEIAVTCLLFLLIWQKTKVSFDIKNMAKTMFAAALMTLLLFLFARPLAMPLSPMGLGAAVLFSGVFYFGVLYMIRGITKEEILGLIRR